MLSMVFGWDSSDMEDCRYQAGRTNRPVYTINEDYYCAVKIGQKPAKSHAGIQWEWEKVESTIAESEGWQVWVCKI